MTLLVELQHMFNQHPVFTGVAKELRHTWGTPFQKPRKP